MSLRLMKLRSWQQQWTQSRTSIRIWLHWSTSFTGVVDQLPKFQGGWNPNKKSILDIFLKLLPWNLFVHNIITESSNALFAGKLPPLTKWEFLWYLGFWFLMFTFSGFSWSNYWSTKNDERTSSCPFFF